MLWSRNDRCKHGLGNLRAPCNREEPSAVKVLPRLTQEQQHLQRVWPEVGRSSSGVWNKQSVLSNKRPALLHRCHGGPCSPLPPDGSQDCPPLPLFTIYVKCMSSQRLHNDEFGPPSISAWYHKSKLLSRVWPLRSHNLNASANDRQWRSVKPNQTLRQKSWSLQRNWNELWSEERFKFLQGLRQATSPFSHIKFIANAPTAAGDLAGNWCIKALKSTVVTVRVWSEHRRSLHISLQCMASGLQTMLLQELIGRRQEHLVSHLPQSWQV